MKFLEKSWSFILVIWLMFVVTLIVLKLLFWTSLGGEDIFSIQEVLDGVGQNDSRLLSHIYRSQIYSPPLVPGFQGQVGDGDDVTAEGEVDPASLLIRNKMTSEVLSVLKEKRNGFFLECRSYDGGFLSKTTELEGQHNWTGILVEPDPYLFPKLLARKRNAWLLNACISPDPIAHSLDFLRKVSKAEADSIEPLEVSEVRMGVFKEKSVYRDSKGQLWRKMRIPCYPLFSIAASLQVTVIDLLVLDTQGLELQILMNIPWNEVVINVIFVNTKTVPEGPEGVQTFLNSKGYVESTAIGHFHTFALRQLHLDNSSD